MKEFFLRSSLNLSWCSSVPFPHALPLVTGSRVRHLPLHVPSSGGCREQRGRPSASCSECPQPLLTARAFLPLYKLCCPPLEAFEDFNVLFFLSRTTSNIQGEAAPTINVAGEPLSACAVFIAPQTLSYPGVLWLMLSLLPPAPPNPFLQSCSPATRVPVCAWRYSLLLSTARIHNKQL